MEYLLKVLIWDGESGGEETVRRLLESSLGDGSLRVDAVVTLGRGKGTWRRAIADFLSGERGDCLLTIGGAGYAADEIVPEVTEGFIRRPVPGIAEAIREAGAPLTPFAPLFRGVCGLADRGRLIINLPSEDRWLASSLSFMGKVLGHALDKAKGDPRDCGHPE